MSNTIVHIIIVVAFFILFVLMIGFIIYNTKQQQKFLQEMDDRYDARNIKFFEDFKNYNTEFLTNLVTTLNKDPDDYEIDLLSKTFVKLRNSIKDSCSKAMIQTKAVRLAIYLFHNGSVSTHGINFFKMSCICEKVAIGSGVHERAIDHNSMPINLFDDMIDELINHNKYIIMNDESIEQTTSHKMFISSPKVMYSQALPIFDLENNILGFVLIEMDHEYERDRALKEAEYIDELVKQLIPILSYSDYSKTASTTMIPHT